MTDYLEYKVKTKVEKFVKAAFKILFAIIAVIIFALLLGYGIMWLWNWLIPDLFGLTTINYWQAVGILVLAKILFGGLGNHNPGKSKGKKGRRCIPQKQDSLKSNFSKWKHYEKFWEEEGQEAYNKYVERIQQEKQ
ncbi:hypothetical protein [Kriegella aquimaris]|uniref:Uncharacterized protein n=1 Tax=Kriegella aquimaris TaxID=192904 RepID=A0A1G9QXI5_9FLAO|nr:hypothetical protein [Kriegella aquimaris]SDM15694.1 hypothetical protein SAMN04488514_105257 [Kriegella aquimaris]